MDTAPRAAHPILWSMDEHHPRPRRRAPAAADCLHHRQRRLRAFLVLRDAQHPHPVPDHHLAAVPAGGAAHAGGEGRVPHLRDRRVLLPAARRLAGRPLLRQVQHRAVDEPGVLPRPRLPGDLRAQPPRFLRRPRADRAGRGRHQAAGGVVHGRPVRPVEQAPGQGGVRRVLLDHQLRLVLRFAADAAVPAPLRRGGGVRHSRRPDVHRHRGVLAGPPAVRDAAADAAGPQRVLAGVAHRVADPSTRAGAARFVDRGGRRAGGAGRLQPDRLARLRDRRLPRAGGADRRRRRRCVVADGACPRPASGRGGGRRATCCGCW